MTLCIFDVGKRQGKGVGVLGVLWWGVCAVTWSVTKAKLEHLILS